MSENYPEPRRHYRYQPLTLLLPIPKATTKCDQAGIADVQLGQRVAFSGIFETQ